MAFEEAIRFKRDGWIVEEKFDGIRASVSFLRYPERYPEATGRIFADGRMKLLRNQDVVEGWHRRLAGCVFDGELLPSGQYHIFDLLVFKGDACFSAPLSERKALLHTIADWLPDHASLVRSFSSVSEMPTFEEGVVWKRLGAPYGHDWFKAKRQVTVDCQVACVLANGVALTVGREKIVGCPGSVKAGDIIECVAFKVFASGALRNGRFLRARPDKGCAPFNLTALSERAPDDYAGPDAVAEGGERSL
jgi:hypothetical protein